MSWFINHYEQVESNSNRGRYVADCVENTRLPGKFKNIPALKDITFDPDNNYSNRDITGWESHVKVKLPVGWKIQKTTHGSMKITNAENKTILEATVSDNRGYHNWTYELIQT